jgi:hypothetical protein
MNKSGIVTALMQRSPFLAFKRDELEKLEQRQRSKKKLYVRFGYQWLDDSGGTKKHLSIALRNKLRLIFEDASKTENTNGYTLNYASLRGEAGKPLLHRIVFDILSADLLFFDVTEINANVMFELGIAYAANARLFLLRKNGAKKQLPSDLAGLTYSDYELGRDLVVDSFFEQDVKSVMQKTIKTKVEANR